MRIKTQNTLVGWSAATLVLLTTAATSAAPHPPGEHGSTEGLSELSAVVHALEERSAKQPENTITLSKLGSAQLALARRSGHHEDFTYAEQTFQRQLQLIPDSASAHLGIAYCQLGRHQFNEALDAARTVARLQPNDPSTLAMLGDVHYALGNDAEAEAFFQMFASMELSMHSLSRLGMIHEHRGRFAEAERAYAEAIQAGEMLQAPAHDRAWCKVILGEFKMQSGAFDEARQMFADALATDPHSSHARWRLAQVDLVRGDIKRGTETLDMLVHDDPRPAFIIALGQALQLAGESERAEAMLNHAEGLMVDELRTGELGHIRALVELWLLRDTELDRAAHLAMQDLHEVRTDARTLETAAWAQFKLGHHSKAAQLIDLSLQHSSSSARALWRAADIHEAAGTVRRARALRAAALVRNESAERLAFLAID